MRNVRKPASPNCDSTSVTVAGPPCGELGPNAEAVPTPATMNAAAPASRLVRGSGAQIQPVAAMSPVRNSVLNTIRKVIVVLVFIFLKPYLANCGRARRSGDNRHSGLSRRTAIVPLQEV